MLVGATIVSGGDDIQLASDVVFDSLRSLIDDDDNLRSLVAGVSSRPARKSSSVDCRLNQGWRLSSQVNDTYEV